MARAEDGLAGLFAEGMAAAGIPEYMGREFEAGDMAVVRVGNLEAGTLFTGKRWALVAGRGLAFASLDESHVRRVWRLHHG